MHREQPLAILLQGRKLRIQPFQEVDSLAAPVDLAAETFDGILQPVIFRTRRLIENEKKQQINDTNNGQHAGEQKLFALPPVGPHCACPPGRYTTLSLTLKSTVCI